MIRLEEEKWAYGPKSERKGPFSKKEIRDLIERGVITPETRLSIYNEKNNYSGVDDYPVIKTEFGVYFPYKVFITATKDDPVPDLYMWLGLFAPLLILAVGYFVGGLWDPTQPGATEPRNIYFIIFIGFGAIISSCFFCKADFDAMRRRGYMLSTLAQIYIVVCFFVSILVSYILVSYILKVFTSLLVLIFVDPVYFYFRNKQLRRSLTPVWVSIACLLLLIGMSYAWPNP